MDGLKKLALKAKRNPNHFEKLYRETFDMALRYFAGRVKTGADLEDLIQDFYLKLYRSLSSFDDSGSFYALFYSVARSVYVDWVRKNAKQQAGSEEFREPSDNDHAFESSEKRIDVRRALEKLKEDEREIIMLFFYDGLSNEEIARILDISIENVKVKKHRALKKLKEELKSYG